MRTMSLKGLIQALPNVSVPLSSMSAIYAAAGLPEDTWIADSGSGERYYNQRNMFKTLKNLPSS